MLAPRRVLRFEAFSIDLARCALLRGDEVLALRPQAFDVLRHLAECPGRVVTKDELIAAVWAAKPASDNSLVQCIKDIRQALGDHTRRIVQTVPRRGYMLAAEVVEGATTPPSGLSAGGTRRLRPEMGGSVLRRWRLRLPLTLPPSSQAGRGGPLRPCRGGRPMAFGVRQRWRRRAWSLC